MCVFKGCEGYLSTPNKSMLIKAIYGGKRVNNTYDTIEKSKYAVGSWQLSVKTKAIGALPCL
jgi:hypothetical protein